MKKILTIILKTIKFIPLLWILLIYSYCIRVRINYGDCPNNSITDPDYLYPYHQSIIKYSLKYGVYAILFFLLFSFLKILNVNLVTKKDIIILVVGIIIFIMSLAFPVYAVWILGD